MQHRTQRKAIVAAEGEKEGGFGMRWPVYKPDNRLLIQLRVMHQSTLCLVALNDLVAEVLLLIRAVGVIGDCANEERNEEEREHVGCRDIMTSGP